tara:strand:- start:1827 stop:2039 length:213 start_codon:yes stop_codon:yes gene_type:complete
MIAILSGLLVNALTPLLLKLIYTNSVKDLLIKLLRKLASLTETEIDDDFVDTIIEKISIAAEKEATTAEA